MAKTEKSWEKRLSGGPDEMSINFVESLSFDRRLYLYDIQGSIAHATMIQKQGFITENELETIKNGLLEVQEEIENGEFVFDVVQEDIHMAIEAALVKKTGDIGKKLHTGRSRNDQVATDMRLWMRDEIEIIQHKLRTIQKSFVLLADKYTDDIMPSYTHLQRAQPVSIAAYLLSFVEQFERDYNRFADCAKRVNISPLGSGAVAGSTLDLDREFSAELLGFDDITYNSIDAVSDRDFCAEFIFASSLVMTHLSRLAEDFIIYMTTEFNFIKISDKYCTSSSMMPQKRNPDMLELIRGKTAGVYGALASILTLVKALPSTYNRDMQEDKLYIFKAADYVNSCLEMASGIVNSTEFKTKNINNGIDEGFLDATSLAEYLVKKGVPFREAHGVVGAMVADCENNRLQLAQMKVADMKTFCDKIEADIFDSLGAHNVAKMYTSKGASGSIQSKDRIEYWKQELDC